MNILDSQLQQLKNSGYETPSGLYTVNLGMVVRAGSQNLEYARAIYAIIREDKSIYLDLTALLVLSSWYDLLVLDRREVETVKYRVAGRDIHKSVPRKGTEFTIFTNDFAGSQTPVPLDLRHTFATID